MRGLLVKEHRGLVLKWFRQAQPPHGAQWLYGGWFRWVLSLRVRRVVSTGSTTVGVISEHLRSVATEEGWGMLPPVLEYGGFDKL